MLFEFWGKIFFCLSNYSLVILYKNGTTSITPNYSWYTKILVHLSILPSCVGFIPPDTRNRHHPIPLFCCYASLYLIQECKSKLLQVLILYCSFVGHTELSKSQSSALHR